MNLAAFPAHNRRHSASPSDEAAVDQAISDMMQYHSALARGYNSIYQQAEYVTTADTPGFIVYALTWWRVVRKHLVDEEHELFVHIQSRVADLDVFQKMEEQHSMFPLFFSLPLARCSDSDTLAQVYWLPGSICSRRLWTPSKTTRSSSTQLRCSK